MIKQMTVHHAALCLLREDHQMMFEFSSSHRAVCSCPLCHANHHPQQRKYRARETSKQILTSLQHEELQPLISYFYYQCKSQIMQNKMRHVKIAVCKFNMITMIEPFFQQSCYTYLSIVYFFLIPLVPVKATSIFPFMVSVADTLTLIFFRQPLKAK